MKITKQQKFTRAVTDGLNKLTEFPTEYQKGGFTATILGRPTARSGKPKKFSPHVPINDFSSPSRRPTVDDTIRDALAIYGTHELAAESLYRQLSAYEGHEVEARKSYHADTITNTQLALESMSCIVQYAAMRRGLPDDCILLFQGVGCLRPYTYGYHAMFEDAEVSAKLFARRDPDTRYGVKHYALHAELLPQFIDLLAEADKRVALAMPNGTTSQYGTTGYGLFAIHEK